MAIRAKITQITLGVHLRVAMVRAGILIGAVSKTMRTMVKPFVFVRNAVAVRGIVHKVCLCSLYLLKSFSLIYCFIILFC